MSKTTKKKHVVKEVLDNYVLPEENQQIAVVLAGKGNNLHQVETENGEVFLASMPTKFRKNVWIKRGDYVILDSIEEGDKVKAEITIILYKDQIKYIKSEGKWPKRFEEAKSMEKNEDKIFPDSDDDDDLCCNMNRNMALQESESDDESSSETEEESD